MIITETSKRNKRPILAVRLSPEEKRLVDEYARLTCVNLSALVRRLLLDHIEKNRRS